MNLVTVPRLTRVQNKSPSTPLTSFIDQTLCLTLTFFLSFFLAFRRSRACGPHTCGCKKRKVSILGSTGSIGTQTLDVCRQNPGKFTVVALTARTNIDLLVEQIREFSPDVVAVGEEKLAELQRKLETVDLRRRPVILTGVEGLCRVASHESADVVVTGIVGCAGLLPTVAAIESGKDVALANKETLIAAGPVIEELIKKHRSKILPVDSEHSAIFQTLQGVPENSIKEIILTGSGGAFRDYSLEEMKKASNEWLRERATTHPNWDMGAKITVDSATMMNKGLEVIEAHFLFDVSYDQIRPVIHPQSIAHSGVVTRDGSCLMQMSWPDMRLPIIYALSYPNRVDADFPHPRNGLSFSDFWKRGDMSFYEPDLEKYPCLRLAFEAGRRGGTCPAILSAANEELVDSFLNREIEFFDISRILEDVLRAAEEEKVVKDTYLSLNDILEADRWGRQKVKLLLKSQ